MYCCECGKPNPDTAKFCAYCGTKLLTPVAERGLDTAEEFAARPEPEAAKQVRPARPEPKRAEPQSVRPEPAKPDPHQAFKRPAEGANVRPLADNPAQPSKRPAASGVQPPAEKPQPPAQRAPEAKAVTSSGGQVTLPSRAPNVKRKRYGEVTHRTPMASPFRQAQQRMGGMIPGARPEQGDDGLFFEDIDVADDFGLDEEDRFGKRLKLATGVLFLVLVISAILWLFFTTDGQVFLAGIGMNASAEAYCALGDQALSKGEVKRAAEAYHDALKRDPGNYQYALKTGVAYQKIPDYDMAYAAFNKCIELRETSPEPYRLLAELLEQQGGAQAGEQVRQLGYEKTGDQSLLDRGITSGETGGLAPAA